MPALLSTDPLCLARDADNELIVPMRVARGMEALLILVRCRLLLWRDEWFLDRDAGMPWLETPDGVVTEADAILGQVFDAAKVARAVRREILTVPGVVDVPELRCAFDGETRNLTISFVVKARFADLGDVTSAETRVALAA
jgi:hypothetical protein